MDGFPRTGLCCHSCEVYCSLRKQCTDLLGSSGLEEAGKSGQRRIRKVSGDSLYSEKTSGWWHALEIARFLQGCEKE